MIHFEYSGHRTHHLAQCLNFEGDLHTMHVAVLCNGVHQWCSRRGMRGMPFPNYFFGNIIPPK